MNDQDEHERAFCDQCGEGLTVGARFCATCGAAVDEAFRAEAVRSDHRSRRRIVGPVAAVLVLVTAAVVVSTLLGVWDTDEVLADGEAVHGTLRYRGRPMPGAQVAVFDAEGRRIGQASADE